MPELAEVEVVRQTLADSLIGLKIVGFECYYPAMIEGEVSQFIHGVLNKSFKEIKRYAKYLIFVLEDGAFISHLRMEGKYYYLLEEAPNMKHTHSVFHLSNGYKLLYVDVRKFGRIEYKKIEDIYTTAPLVKLGIEANNPNYSIEEIYEKIKKRTIPIKSILLDQTVISGLGNIYVDEVLFASRIHPLTKGFELSKKQVVSILENSRLILNEAILHKGTTIRSYTSSLGVTGEFQEFLKVHTKKVCPCCNKEITKIKIGGRTSYFCESCQG